MEQEFKLLITGDASSAVDASQKAGDGLRKLKGDTGDLNSEMAHVPEGWQKSGEAAKDFGKKTEEAGDKVEKLSKGELRRLGNELGNAAGLGKLGGLAMGGLAAGAFAAGQAIEYLKKTWEEIQESIKGPINVEIHDDSARIISAAEAWNQYAEARKKVVEAANSAEAVAGKGEKALENKVKLLHEILKAEEEEQLANLATKKDQMSPQQYAAAEAGIKKTFGDKNTAVDEDVGFAGRMAIKEKEAARLEDDAKKKKAEADKMTLGNQDAQGAAIANGAGAQTALKEINEHIEMIKGLHEQANGGDRPEYEGVGGKVKYLGDLKTFQNRYGFSANSEDALKQEEARKAQAESQIALAKQAAEQQERLKKKKGDLLTTAGTESGQAEVLRGQITDEKTAFNEQSATRTGTDAIGAAKAAITQEHAAENNNTAQGHKDALKALTAGTNAAAQIQTAIQQVGNTNKELHDALFQSLLDMAAENKKLAAKIKNSGYNGK